MKTQTIKTSIRRSLLSLAMLFIFIAFSNNNTFAQSACNANFSYSTDSINTGAVTFTYASNSLPTNGFIYSWNFGDGSFATANTSASFTHNYNATGGSYVVCLTVNDSINNCNATFCDSVILGSSSGANCTAYFSANDSANYVYFTNQSVFTNATCSWDFGDGTTGTGNDIIHQYSANGTYTACIYIIDNTGAVSCSFCSNVVVGNNSSNTCNASFAMYPDSANGSSNTYIATNYSTGNSLNYFWNFGDGTSSSLQNPIHTFGAVGNTTGTYTICLTVTSSVDSTCNSTYCETITISNPSSSCYAAFQLSSNSSNTNTYYATNYSTGNSLNYVWDFGDGTASTLVNPAHTFAANGAYTVCLTVTSSVDSTCTNTYCDYITIGNNTGNCTANFIMYLDSANTGTNTYTAYNYSTGNSLNYFWNFGDGTTSALQNPSHTFSSNGIYTVCLTVSSSLDSACYNSFCQTLTIGGNPVGGCNASFQVMQDSTNTSNFFLYLSSNNSNLYYSWDFGDGTSSTQQYPTHTYAGSGPYVVCLTVSDNNGCTDMFCDSVYAGRASGVLSITVVNPMAASVNDHSIIINSLVNYPNPFTNTTTISYSIKYDASIELNVLDLLGNKIAVIESGNKASGTYQTDWNASNISAGIYMLQLKVNNEVSIKKLMITK